LRLRMRQARIERVQVAVDVREQGVLHIQRVMRWLRLV
jgi:hypothetical protein